MQEFNFIRNVFSRVASQVCFDAILLASKKTKAIYGRQNQIFFSPFKYKIDDLINQCDKNIKLVSTYLIGEKKTLLFNECQKIIKHAKSLMNITTSQNITHKIWVLQCRIDEVRFLIGDKEWRTSY